jgi:hypothetical protein
MARLLTLMINLPRPSLIAIGERAASHMESDNATSLLTTFEFQL